MATVVQTLDSGTIKWIMNLSRETNCTIQRIALSTLRTTGAWTITDLFPCTGLPCNIVRGENVNAQFIFEVYQFSRSTVKEVTDSSHEKSQTNNLYQTKSQVTGDKPVTCKYLQAQSSPEITGRKIQPLVGAILAIFNILTMLPSLFQTSEKAMIMTITNYI